MNKIEATLDLEALNNANVHVMNQSLLKVTPAQVLAQMREYNKVIFATE